METLTSSRDVSNWRTRPGRTERLSGNRDSRSPASFDTNHISSEKTARFISKLYCLCSGNVRFVSRRSDYLEPRLGRGPINLGAIGPPLSVHTESRIGDRIWRRRSELESRSPAVLLPCLKSRILTEHVSPISRSPVVPPPTPLTTTRAGSDSIAIFILSGPHAQIPTC